MRKVAVVGIGSTKMAQRHPEATYFELAQQATREALEDAGVEINEVDKVVYGIYNEFFQRQIMSDAFCHFYTGFKPHQPSTRVTTGGATGGAAFRTGYLEVASGQADICVVCGAEKSTDLVDIHEVLKMIMYSIDMTWEYQVGIIPTSMFALYAVRHMAKYGTTEAQMAHVSVKNHANAILNPDSQSPMEITVEKVLNSRYISTPLKLYDCCLYTEGSGAVVLASEDAARKLTDRPVWITGVGYGQDSKPFGHKKDFTFMESNLAAAREAYDMAGIKDPLQAVDMAEVHDAFTIHELMSLEDLGFCPPGRSGPMVEDGSIGSRDSQLPVNVSGGLIGCGHAIGATGVYQIVELVRHLRGRAEKKQANVFPQRQVPGAHCGLAHSQGGVGLGWTTVFILES